MKFKIYKNQKKKKSKMKKFKKQMLKFNLKIFNNLIQVKLNKKKKSSKVIYLKIRVRKRKKNYKLIKIHFLNKMNKI